MYYLIAMFIIRVTVNGTREGEALPVIVPNWNRCWNRFNFGDFFSLLCFFWFILVAHLRHVDIQAHSASPGYGPSAVITALRIAHSYCFTATQNRNDQAGTNFSEGSLNAPIISTGRGSFSSLVSFLLQQAVGKQITSSVCSLLNSILKLGSYFFSSLKVLVGI